MWGYQTANFFNALITEINFFTPSINRILMHTVKYRDSVDILTALLGCLANWKALQSIGFWKLLKGWAVQKTAGPILTIHMSYDVLCTRSCLLAVIMTATVLKFLVVSIF